MIEAVRGATEMLKDLAYYDILPDGIKKLKNELSEPIENDDVLFWKANLKYKLVGNNTKKTKNDFFTSYNKILRKYSKIS